MLLLLTAVPGTPGLKRSAGVRLSTSNNIDVLRDKLLSIMARKDQNQKEVRRFLLSPLIPSLLETFSRVQLQSK